MKNACELRPSCKKPEDWPGFGLGARGGARGLGAAGKGQAHLEPLFPLTAIPRRIHRISSDLRS